MKTQILLFAMMLFPLVASADDSGTCGNNVTYSFVESTGTLRISGSGSMTNYESSNKAPWYDYRSNIITVIIDNGITSIGKLAFYKCNSLTTIDIPNTVTVIEGGAFYDCSSLAAIDIPKGVTSIKNGTFQKCSSITTIDIPDGVTTIEDLSFYECKKLTSITIPSSVTYVGGYAFTGTAWDDNLEDGLIYVGRVLYRYKGEMPENTKITIKEGTTSIGPDAFSCKTNLVSIDFPEGILSIGQNAFENCINITSPIILPNSMKSIEKSAFFNCKKIPSINIPDNVEYIGSNAFQSCESLRSIHIPNNLTTIESQAFSNCKSLETITIPESVTTIGYKAFSACTNLRSITIGSNATDIIQAFDHCSSISEVYCYPIEPFGMSVNGIPIENATLYVPQQSIIKYQNQRPWKNFGKILAIPGTEGKNIISKEIVVSTMRYTTESIGGITTQECLLNIWNTSSNDILIKNITVYKPSNNEIIFENSNESFLQTNSILPVSIKYNGNYLTMGEWIVKIDYVNLYDNYVYTKLAIKKANSYGSNIQLEDISDYVIDNSSYYKLIYLVDDVEYKKYEIKEGETITPEAAPEKEGYTFSGWSEISETMPAHDVIVTGTFNINKYKLIYKVDSEEYKSCEVEYGATIAPEAAPTKEGYTFSGWSEIPETMPAKDVTITGSFAVNKYKLIYKVDDAEYKTYEVEYGATITPETAPTKEGYTFSGWSEIPETMPAHDVTVTGTFNINKYKLIYKVDDEEYKSYDVEYGAIITAETEPTKEGYTFSGWSEILETMPAKDVTITGSFTFIDAIEDVIANDGTYEIYTLDGKQVEALQKGVNIIKYKKGSTQKVYVK